MSKAAFTISALAAAALSACVAAGGDPPGDALAEVTTECQQQELAPEFDIIRSRVSMSVVGAEPAQFMVGEHVFSQPWRAHCYRPLEPNSRRLLPAYTRLDQRAALGVFAAAVAAGHRNPPAGR